MQQLGRRQGPQFPWWGWTIVLVLYVLMFLGGQIGGQWLAATLPSLWLEGLAALVIAAWTAVFLSLTDMRGPRPRGQAASLYPNYALTGVLVGLGWTPLVWVSIVLGTCLGVTIDIGGGLLAGNFSTNRMGWRLSWWQLLLGYIIIPAGLMNGVLWASSTFLGGSLPLDFLNALVKGGATGLVLLLITPLSGVVQSLVFRWRRGRWSASFMARYMALLLWSALLGLHLPNPGSGPSLPLGGQLLGLSIGIGLGMLLILTGWFRGER